MLEEQVERVRGETEGIGEAVGRAREVVEVLEKEAVGGSGGGEGRDEGGVEGRERRRERGDKRVWEVLEREVGRL